MKVLADENCDHLVVLQLRAAGHDVSYVVDWASGLDDEAVFAIAHRQRRLLLTQDHDFGVMAERLVARPLGVVLLRLEELTSQSRAILVVDTFDLLGDELINCLTVIEPGRIRQRPFIL
jgi:predicted nuclease of predicted toxin-antitoxin system